ncbi:alpha-L RNA-binding motif-containing protein [Trametes versicolor FP-101664 SS1]|uniref:alpha-L RNA-binding motif-containing protein n=1 Tax=Trametes versicolor (strain FP-101664) TaxID=717944 RepID=UPI0004624316|nr:alpha-L RNA-binding motif-containing protein [Trametes versicolor FP-101664 SS1]EIW56157.1 alpha-L RNA-binding motif-containing protein [Trametes versicolor FP-101664 SS1]
MRDARVYNFKRALPRMSWHPHNLFNLWRRSYGPLQKITDRVEYKETLNWRRWTAKSLLRGYHGDYINEKIFKRWYLPDNLPDVRPPASLTVDAGADLNKWALKDNAADKAAKRAEEERRKGLAPVGSLMFSEVERRIDVVIFRACFAHSVYDARRMVVHGSVLLNGKKHTNPNARLAPGDMVSVDPAAIPFLQKNAARWEAKDEEEDASEATAEAAEEEADSEDSPEDAEAAAAEAEDATEAEEVPEPAEEPEATPTESNDLKSRYTQKRFVVPGTIPEHTPFHLPAYAAPFMFIPAYLEPSFSTCSVIYLRHPTARPGYSEIPTPWDADGEIVRLTWEWYSKRRMRIRSKSQLARMPENRQ